MKNTILGIGVLFVSINSFADTGEKSFTPTGFKFPVMKISIGKNTGSVGTAVSISNEQVIYRCSSTTAANCLVDLTSQTELDAISTAATGVTVDVGTYDMLTLSTCADGTSGSTKVSVWVKGSFVDDSSSTTYYTDATATNGLSTTSGSAAFTEITNWGCATKSILLASPIVVEAAGTVVAQTTDTSASPTPTPTASLTQTLTVLVDNTYLANSTPTTTSGMGGCKSTGVSSRGICVNIPAVLPYVGTDTTTTKRYLLSHSSVSSGAIVDSKANAIVIVPMAGTTPLTVFAGPYYSNTSAGHNSNTSAATSPIDGGPSYNTSTDVSSFKVNADGTLTFFQGGSADIYAGSFKTFSLSNHSSTCTSRDASLTWYYHAAPF